MDRKVIEIIPCKDFNKRLVETKKAITMGYSVEHIDNNVICVKYKNKRKH